MAYRSDVDALEARVKVLSAELADRERERDEVARMLAEARAKEQADRIAADYAAGGPQRRRRRLAIATAVAATLVAGLFAWRIAHRHHDTTARLMRQLDQFADQMCACPDASCVQHVSEAMAKWAIELEREGVPEHLDDATMRRAEAIAERVTTCTQKAMGQAPISTNGAQ
ncbi:MAG: hypothetical protein ACM31C_17560 [Acidobacteriota bacterium]